MTGIGLSATRGRQLSVDRVPQCGDTRRSYSHMRIGVIAAGLLVVLLAVFNPGMDDFTAFVESEAAVILQTQLGESPLARALAGAGAGMIRGIVERMTERTNYFVFSTYTIDFGVLAGLPESDVPGGRESGEEEWTFVGVAGRFVELHRPESLR